MLRLSYIGATGFVQAPRDVAIAAACVALTPPSHCFMAGVLASAKTLRGEPTPSRRYPPFRAVERLLYELDDLGAWPVVHFNCRDGLDEHLARLAEECPSMRGLQLNVANPDPEAIARFLRLRSDVAFVLQVNRGAVERGAPITAEAIAAYVARYAEVATYALIDLSGGEGKALDTALALDVLRRWSPAWQTRPSFAGGLGPHAEETVQVLCRDGGHDPRGLSFDAESLLRTPCTDPIPGERHQDTLDPDLAPRWVACAASAIRSALPTSSP